jgi:hypothetical protein
LAITNGYITLAVLKASLGISDTVDDTALEQAVEAASRAIDGHCSRRFWTDSTATARVFYPDTPYVCRVDEFHTTTDLAVKTDTGDDGTYEQTWASSDYQLEPLNGVADGREGVPYRQVRAVGDYTFPTTNASNRAPVQVTAKWGWAAVPEPVQQACLLLAAELFKRKDAPFGVAGFGDFGAVRIREDARVMSMLAPYRRVILA